MTASNTQKLKSIIVTCTPDRQKTVTVGRTELWNGRFEPINAASSSSPLLWMKQLTTTLTTATASDTAPSHHGLGNHRAGRAASSTTSISLLGATSIVTSRARIGRVIARISVHRYVSVRPASREQKEGRKKGRRGEVRVQEHVTLTEANAQRK